jgi:sugar-specific transcriptional regulator TrmB
VNVLTLANEDFFKKTIRGLGLTEIESKVYIFVAKCGPLKGGEIAQHLKMPKSEVYHVLKSLQSKGWSQSTLEFPARFMATPLTEVLDAQIKMKRGEAQSIETIRKEVLIRWRSLTRTKDEPAPEKYVVIEGRNKIFAKIFQMIEEANESVLVLISGIPLVQTINAGTDKVIFKKIKQSQIKIRVLTQISIDNFQAIDKNDAIAHRQGLDNRVIMRHLSDSSFYCRFLIRDKREALLFLTPRPTANPREDHEDSALWTNSTAVVNALSAFFEELWSDARDGREKLKEIMSQQLS